MMDILKIAAWAWLVYALSYISEQLRLILAALTSIG